MVSAELFRVIVDTLSSIASIVAIVVALTAWYRASRRPLKLSGAVVHNAADATTFILVLKNRKDFPVTISEIDCYTQKTYTVQRKVGGRPEYSVSYLGSTQVFRSRPDFEVPPGGNTDLRIKVDPPIRVPTAFLLLTKTSHGYHELWCRNPTVVDIGAAEVYSVESRHQYSSPWPARARYLWERVKAVRK